jgi:hypothetical protein
MTCSPKGPIAKSVTWEEVAQLGMPEQIGCPDVRPLGPTVAQLLKAPKVTQAALAGFLAIVKSYHEAFGRLPDEYQGACNVPIPIEVIALIGEKLAKESYPGCRHRAYGGRQHIRARHRERQTTRRGQRPWHVQTLLAREPGDLAIDRSATAVGPHREGEEP